MTGGTLPNPEWSNRGRHTREDVLNEFWQISVDDRSVRRESIDTHKNALSKSLFS